MSDATAPANRVLVITGASSGIGAATARHASGAGWRVVLAARWSVTDGAARTTLRSERVSIPIALADTSDAAVATAMTQAVSELAREIAPALTGPRRSR